MKPPIDINFAQGLFQPWQTATDYIHQGVENLTNSTQQLSQSLQETANTTTDKAIEAFTNKVDQSWQTADEVKNTTSVAVKTAVTSAVNDWLIQHPTFLKLVQIVNWATNHPVISLVIFLIGLTLVWSIIKSIMRLIETASWSLLQVPLRLIQAVITVSFFSLIKAANFAIAKIRDQSTDDQITDLLPNNTEAISLSKQQRLAEITHRLAIIQQEQKELLQEAAALIDQDIQTT